MACNPMLNVHYIMQMLYKSQYTILNIVKKYIFELSYANILFD